MSTRIQGPGRVQTPTNTQGQPPLPALSTAQVRALGVAINRAQTPEQLAQLAQRLRISPENLVRYLRDPATVSRLPQSARAKAAQMAAAMVRAQQQEEQQQQTRNPAGDQQNRNNPAAQQQGQGNPLEQVFNLFSFGLYGLIKGAITGAMNQEQRRAPTPGGDNRATPPG